MTLDASKRLRTPAVATKVELIEEPVEIVTVFDEGVGIGSWVVELVGISLANQVGHDAAGLA